MLPVLRHSQGAGDSEGTACPPPQSPRGHQSQDSKAPAPVAPLLVKLHVLNPLPPLPRVPRNRALFGFLLNKNAHIIIIFFPFFFFLLYNKLKCNLHPT